MAWVKFNGEFWYEASPQATIQYLPGMELNVPKACAEQAIAEGKAVALDKGKNANDT